MFASSISLLGSPTQANHTWKTRTLLLLGRCECRWPPSWLRSSKKVAESVFQHTVRCGSLRHKSLSQQDEGGNRKSSKGCLKLGWFVRSQSLASKLWIHVNMSCQGLETFLFSWHQGPTQLRAHSVEIAGHVGLALQNRYNMFFRHVIKAGDCTTSSSRVSWHCLEQPSDYANSHLFHYSHISIKWSGCLWEAPRWNTRTRQTNTFDSVIHLMPFKTCVMGCLFNGSWGAIRAWIRWPRLYLQKLSQMILKVSSRQELMWTKFAPAICFTRRLKSHFNWSNWLISEICISMSLVVTCVRSWL